MSFDILWLVPDAANPVFGAYADILRSTGHKVALYDFHARMLEIGLRRMQREVISELPRRTAQGLVLVSLFGESYELPPKFIGQIGRCVPVALWQADDEIYSTLHTIHFVATVDAVITTDYWGRGLFDQIGTPTFYLPFHFPDPPSDFAPAAKSIDVSFIGNVAVADRKQMLDYLRTNGISVEVFGNGSANGPVSRERFREIVAASRINLNFTKTRLSADVLRREPWRSGVRQAKGRVFEVAAIGGFCLSESAPHLGQVMHIGEEIDTFDGKEDLLRKVRRHLERDAEREKIAATGNRRLKQDWDPRLNLTRIFAELANRFDTAMRERPQRVLPAESGSFRYARAQAAAILSAAMFRKGRVRIGFEMFRSGLVPLDRHAITGMAFGLGKIIRRFMNIFAH